MSHLTSTVCNNFTDSTRAQRDVSGIANVLQVSDSKNSLNTDVTSDINRVQQLHGRHAHVHQGDAQRDVSGISDSLQMHISRNSMNTYVESDNCDDSSARRVTISYEPLEQAHDSCHVQLNEHSQDSGFTWGIQKG